MTDMPPGPPRGSGRHSRNPRANEARANWPTAPIRRNRPDPDPYSATGYPGGQVGATHPAEDDFPTDPTMRSPLNFAPRDNVGTGTARMTRARPIDVVVPRVYLEPDEVIDRLRRRALWWAITRDMVVVAVGLYLLGSWALVPVWRALGG